MKLIRVSSINLYITNSISQIFLKYIIDEITQQDVKIVEKIISFLIFDCLIALTLHINNPNEIKASHKLK